MFSDVWKAAAIAAALACLVAIGFAWHYAGEVRELERKAGASDQGLQTCTDTNAGEGLVITDLAQRLEACASAKAGHLVELETLRLERVQLGQRQAAEFNQEREKREEIYETDDDCGALRRVPVCARIAERVRESARGGAD